MSYVILSLILAAFAHFIYESVLAPSLRLKLRFELFALRDELRLLKIECDPHLDDQHFDHLQDSLNSLIRVIPRFDLGTLAAVEHELRTNPELRRQTEARSKFLDDCNIPQAKQIHQRSLRIASQAFSVNSGGWFLYLFPLLLPLIGYSKLRKATQTLLSLSERDLNEVAPFSQDQTVV